MIGQGLKFKINWLEKNINPKILFEIQNTYITEISKHTEKLPKVGRYLEVLQLDLVYSICVHQYWLKTEFFKEFLIENFSYEYLLSREVVNDICSALIKKYISLMPINNSFNVTNKDFLKFIFIQTVTFDENSSLSEKLGLGVTLLNKLKSAATNIESVRDDQFLFLPNIDQEYANIILELSNEFKNTPWIFSSYRLMYETFDIPEPWLSLTWEKNSSWLLKLLVELETHGSVSEVMFCDSLHKIFPIFSADTYKDYGKSLMMYLISKGFIFLEERSRNKFVLRLASDGFKTTAVYYYFKVFKKENSDISVLGGLNGFWQAQIIENLSEDKFEVLYSLLFSSDLIKAEAIIPSVKVLLTKYEVSEIRTELDKKSNLIQNPWVRTSLLEATNLICSVQSSNSAQLRASLNSPEKEQLL